MSEDVEISVEQRIPNHFLFIERDNLLKNYVQPYKDTAIMLPLEKTHVKERNFITCFVTTAPSHQKARETIRQTWGKIIKPIFLIGLSDNDTTNSVINEGLTFNDIIIENFEDCYVNLTIKTSFAMKAFIKYYNESSYFFKVDDDVFVNVQKLYELLKNVPKDSLIGNLETNAEPVRNSANKYFLPKQFYEEDKFPPYVHGPAYLIPGI